MSSSPFAEISIPALQCNLQIARNKATNSHVLAVIKADAYGHGLRRVAEGLRHADGFAVARLEEALELRHMGVTIPVLLLAGVQDEQEYVAACEHDLMLVLHNRQQLDLLETREHPISVWLKLDTGMGRLGFDPSEVGVVLARLQAMPHITIQAVMSHMANAEDEADPRNEIQLQSFLSASRTFGGALSLANSAALLTRPDMHLDWVRPGLMLYGVSPTNHRHDLQCAMRVTAMVIAVRNMRAGQQVGYGGLYTCERDKRIAIVAMGYADGYPRNAGQNACIWYAGHRLPVVGRVSMDMLCVDADLANSIRIGDRVEIWGPNIPVEELAREAETIPYELLCNLGNRVKRITREELFEDN